MIVVAIQWVCTEAGKEGHHRFIVCPQAGGQQEVGGNHWQGGRNEKTGKKNRWEGGHGVRIVRRYVRKNRSGAERSRKV